MRRQNSARLHAKNAARHRRAESTESSAGSVGSYNAPPMRHKLPKQTVVDKARREEEHGRQRRNRRSFLGRRKSSRLSFVGAPTRKPWMWSGRMEEQDDSDTSEEGDGDDVPRADVLGNVDRPERLARRRVTTRMGGGDDNEDYDPLKAGQWVGGIELKVKSGARDVVSGNDSRRGNKIQRRRNFLQSQQDVPFVSISHRELERKAAHRLQLIRNYKKLPRAVAFYLICTAQILWYLPISVFHEVYESMKTAILDPTGHSATSSESYISIEELNVIDDVWDWMVYTLSPTLFDGDDYEDLRFQSYNKLIEGVFIEQERSETVDCVAYRSMYPDCHPVGTDSTAPYSSFVAGTNISTMILSARFDLEDNQAILTSYRDADWLDLNTKQISVSMPFFNGEHQVLSLFRLNLVFERGGFISITEDITMVRANPYVGVWPYDASSGDPSQFFTELLFVGWGILLGIHEISQFYDSYKERVLLKDYLSDIWNAVDVTFITLLLSQVGVWISIVFALSTLEVETTEKPNAAGGENGTVAGDQELYFLEATAIHDNLADIMRKQQLMRFIAMINTVVQSLRLLKYCRFQPRLSLLTDTLKIAAVDLVHALVLWLILFSAFVVAGHLAFGIQLHTFAGVMDSANSCLTMLLGEFGEFFGEMLLANYIAAVFFFWTFMMLMTVVLLSMITAVILGAYDEASAVIEETPSSIIEDLRMVLQDQKRVFGGRMIEYFIRLRNSKYGPRLCCCCAWVLPKQLWSHIQTKKDGSAHHDWFRYKVSTKRLYDALTSGALMQYSLITPALIEKCFDVDALTAADIILEFASDRGDDIDSDMLIEDRPEKPSRMNSTKSVPEQRQSFNPGDVANARLFAAIAKVNEHIMALDRKIAALANEQSERRPPADSHSRSQPKVAELWPAASEPGAEVNTATNEGSPDADLPAISDGKDGNSMGDVEEFMGSALDGISKLAAAWLQPSDQQVEAPQPERIQIRINGDNGNNHDDDNNHDDGDDPLMSVVVRPRSNTEEFNRRKRIGRITTQHGRLLNESKQNRQRVKKTKKASRRVSFENDSENDESSSDSGDSDESLSTTDDDSDESTDGKNHAKVSPHGRDQHTHAAALAGQARKLSQSMRQLKKTERAVSMRHSDDRNDRSDATSRPTTAAATKRTPLPRPRNPPPKQSSSPAAASGERSRRRLAPYADQSQPRQAVSVSAKNGNGTTSRSRPKRRPTRTPLRRHQDSLMFEVESTRPVTSQPTSRDQFAGRTLSWSGVRAAAAAASVRSSHVHEKGGREDKREDKERKAKSQRRKRAAQKAARNVR